MEKWRVSRLSLCCVVLVLLLVASQREEQRRRNVRDGASAAATKGDEGVMVYLYERTGQSEMKMR